MTIKLAFFLTTLLLLLTAPAASAQELGLSLEPQVTFEANSPFGVFARDANSETKGPISFPMSCTTEGSEATCKTGYKSSRITFGGGITKLTIEGDGLKEESSFVEVTGLVSFTTDGKQDVMTLRYKVKMPYDHRASALTCRQIITSEGPRYQLRDYVIPMGQNNLTCIREGGANESEHKLVVQDTMPPLVVSKKGYDYYATSNQGGMAIISPTDLYAVDIYATDPYSEDAQRYRNDPYAEDAQRWATDPYAEDVTRVAADITCTPNVFEENLFSFGETQVTCVAKDKKGNTSSTGFTISMWLNMSAILWPHMHVYGKSTKANYQNGVFKVSFTLLGESANIPDLDLVIVASAVLGDGSLDEPFILCEQGSRIKAQPVMSCEDHAAKKGRSGGSDVCGNENGLGGKTATYTCKADISNLEPGLYYFEVKTRLLESIQDENKGFLSLIR